MQLELRPDDDDRTTRVIDAFAQQVLAEAARLALEHVRQGLQGAVARTGHGATMAAVVEQCVNCLLQHALLVPDNDFRSLELEQVLETIVPVDNPAIEIVEIGGRETSAFERHQRAQIGRNDWQHRQDHPFRTHHGLGEALEQLDALGDLLSVLLGLGLRHGDLEFIHGLVQLEISQSTVNGLGAHLGNERVVTVGGSGLAVLVLGEQLVNLQRSTARVDDQVVLVVDNALQVAGRHIQHQTNAGRHALEEPDVGNRHGQLDVAHPLAANASQCHFDAAPIAHHTPVLDPFVLAAGTFPVLHRTENALAEETALLGLECAVIDGLGVLYFTLRPGAYDLRRGDLDRDVVDQVNLV